MFVKNGDRFDQKEVKVEYLTESRVVIKGLDEGTEVALVDPNAAKATTPSATAPPMPAGGPR